MRSFRGTWMVVVVCFLTLVACQEEPPGNGNGNGDEEQPAPATSPTETLLQINALLREGMDLGRELRDDVDRGDPLDPDKAKRAREIAEKVVELKMQFIDLLPDAGGMPFKQVYQQFKFLDDLIELAANLALSIELGTSGDQTRDFLKQLLRILEAEKDWLWSHWPNLPNAGFESMDNTIDAIQRRLDDPDDNLERVFEILEDLKELKLFAAGELPDRIYGKDIGFWYYFLFHLDARAELTEYIVRRVERDFDEETTVELQNHFFAMEVLKLRMLKTLPD